MIFKIKGTWTPRVCRIAAFRVVFEVLGHCFAYFRGPGNSYVTFIVAVIVVKVVIVNITAIATVNSNSSGDGNGNGGSSSNGSSNEDVRALQICSNRKLQLRVSVSCKAALMVGAGGGVLRV